jgi:phenylacetic acid degradation operon negative regulatory protein
VNDAPTAPALQPQDLVLTLLGAYVRTPGEAVWSGGMVEVLRELGFSTEAARAALARLVTRGLLDRHKAGRLVSYTLTERAHALLAEGDRRIFGFGRAAPAADVWTVLWHAIPDSRRVERSRLAARLRFLGFGSVQDATWVAARDREPEVLRLLGELGVAAHASVLVGRLSDGLGPAALVAEAWDLEAVGRGYAAFVAEFGPYRSARRRRALEPREAFALRTLLLHRYRAFPLADPELPDAAAGVHTLRADVVEVFDAVYAGLERPAEQHFRLLAQPRDRDADPPPPQAPTS